MLDTTAKKLLRLLQPGAAAELRCAAARVLGEIGVRDRDVAQTLCDALDDPELTVRLQVLGAIGQLRIEPALPRLLAKVRDGGPEAPRAAEAAARLGPKGTRALQDLMGQVPPGLRRQIAAALAASGTASAGTAAIEALLDSDPGVVDAAVRALVGEAPTFSESQRRALADQVLALVKPKRGMRLPPPSESALVRLLAALGDPRAEAVYWERIEPGNPPELRAAALQALGTLGVTPGKEKLKALLACAADTDFRVIAPALLILRPLPISAHAFDDWLALLDAPDVAVRRFAIEKLSGRDTPQLAQALVRQVRHPDAGLRAEALVQLGRMEHGRTALAQALLEARSPDEAWALARAQAPFGQQYAPALRARLLRETFAALDEGDRRAEPLLFLLREIDARGLRDRLEERALALRKKKDYERAAVYLRLLIRDPACAESIRFELAGCGLKLSDHNLAAEARSTDPALGQFARLVHNHDVDPAERLRQAKWLDAEDLYYLGFSFVEGDRQEREFGAEALRLVVQRSARSKRGKDARSKLRSAGL
jgi:HEAT repeat protein